MLESLAGLILAGLAGCAVGAASHWAMDKTENWLAERRRRRQRKAKVGAKVGGKNT